MEPLDREYLTGLRERHKIVRGSKAEYPKVGDVVIVKGENKNRNTWKLGKIVRLITGRDGVVRGVELQTENGRLERPLQLIYPLEHHCDQKAVERKTPPLNAQAEEFRPKSSLLAGRCQAEAGRNGLRPLLVKSRFMRTQNSHWSEVPHELISCKYLTRTTFRNVILAGIQSVALKP